MLWPDLVQTAFLQPIHSKVDARRCWAEEMVLAVSWNLIRDFIYLALIA